MKLTVPWPPSAWTFAKHWPARDSPFTSPSTWAPTSPSPWTPGARQRLHLGRRRSEEEDDEDEQVAPKRKILDPEGVVMYEKQT